ncbi:MAG: hypothetical protein GXP55_23405 [Deltaproteobacteria bacterium]|nr:hypothetical protein [Deltaproteobacteria bacterium]
MIQSWSGTGRGYDIRDAAQALNAKVHIWNPDDANLVEVVRQRLRKGDWIVAQLFSSVLRNHYDRHPPPRLGPHGRLGHQLGSLHAVVLAGLQGADLRYFDPFHAADGQPLTMSATLLVEAFQGIIIVCP